MKPSPPFLSSSPALIPLRHVVLRRETRSMRATDARDHYLGYLRGDHLLGLIPLSRLTSYIRLPPASVPLSLSLSRSRCRFLLSQWYVRHVGPRSFSRNVSVSAASFGVSRVLQ